MLNPEGLTGDNVSRIQRIFILNETKAIHKLDLGDFASALAVEVIFNILFRS
jgi:hypothetical protein